MGLLTGEFTEQDEVLNQSKTTNAKTYKPSLAVDVGTSFIYGAEKGLFNVVNAGTRPFIGDEAADKGLANIDRQIKPTHQGTAGHVVSGVTEVLSAAAVTAPLGGAGVATSVGLSTRASEHSRLTQQFGVDQDTADTVSNIGGVSMAALTFVPMSNVFKSGLIDYAATVGGTTLAGQVLQYGQGTILENNGHAKVGEMYKDMATDPTMIMTNLGLGSAFWALGRMRIDPTKTQAEIEQAEAATYDAVDQAIADVDRSSIPTQPETAGDMLQHEANLNQAIDQVMKGEKVNISEATGGQLKTLDDVKNYIRNKNTTNNNPINTTNKKSQSLAEATEANRKALWEKLNPGVKYPTPKTQAKPFTATGTQKRIYDEAKVNGLTDADAKVVVALAHFESRGSFSPTVKNPKSTATGVFQFIDDTWKAEGGTSANRHDLNTQIKLGIQHTKSNIKYIEDKTGIVLTGSQIYVPHLLGRGGAQIVFKAIKENPNQSSRAVIAKFSKDPDHLMKINGIPKNARIDDAVHFFTKKIDAIAAQHYGAESSLSATRVADDAEAIVLTEELTRPTQDLDTTVQRTDLDTFPDLTTDFIGKADVDAFTARHTVSEDPFADITTDVVNLLDDFDLLKLGEAPKRTVEEDAQFSKELNEILEAFNTEVEHASIPHTSKGVQVKDRVNDPAKEFKPDESIATEWTKTQRFEDKKYHDQLTRTYKDQNGHTVQEMQYRGSYVKRVVNDAHKTDFIHVGRSNKSDFVDHKGNKELETALDRIFEDRSFGYLSQIPKGQEAITKLKDNPNLVISSKKTGEDLTVQQWQQKLQREQDNIQMMAKAMSTLAKCALKQAA